MPSAQQTADQAAMDQIMAVQLRILEQKMQHAKEAQRRAGAAELQHEAQRRYEAAEALLKYKAAESRLRALAACAQGPGRQESLLDRIRPLRAGSVFGLPASDTGKGSVPCEGW